MKKNEKSGHRLSVISNQVTNKLTGEPANWLTGKLITSALICVLMLVSAAICVHAAGLDISVTGGSWAQGKVSLNQETTSDQWTVHASGDGTEDISVRVSDVQGWTAGGANNGPDTFGLKTNVGPIVPIIATDTVWKDDADIGDHPFGLWFKAPSSSTIETTHLLTIFLTASDWEAPVPPEPTYCLDANGYWAPKNDGTGDYGCWLGGGESRPTSKSCDQHCAEKGLSCDPGNWDIADGVIGCAILHHLCAGAACDWRGDGYGEYGISPTVWIYNQMNRLYSRGDAYDQDCTSTVFTSGNALTDNTRLCVCEPPPDACGDLTTMYDSRDGKTYDIVAIGDQCWMAENLAYLPSVVGPATASTTLPYYYVFDYDGVDVAAAKATTNYQTYGVLYNWAASVDANLCPAGWRAPSDAEWYALESGLATGTCIETRSGWNECVGAGSKMAGEAGLWNDGALILDDNFGASGLGIVPGSQWMSGAFYLTLGVQGVYRSGFEGGIAVTRTIHNTSDGVARHRGDVMCHRALAVRCLKD